MSGPGLGRMEGACAHETTAEVHGAIVPPSNRRRATPSIWTRIVKSQAIEMLDAM